MPVQSAEIDGREVFFIEAPLHGSDQQPDHQAHAPEHVQAVQTRHHKIDIEEHMGVCRAIFTLQRVHFMLGMVIGMRRIGQRKFFQARRPLTGRYDG